MTARSLRITATLSIACSLGCQHAQPYAKPPPPPCMPGLAKSELRTACQEQQDEAGHRWLLVCPSFGEWTRAYADWRDAVYGGQFCAEAR